MRTKGETAPGIDTEDQAIFIDLPLKATIPGALENGKIPKELLDADVPVEAPLWDDAKYRDTYRIYIANPGGTMTQVGTTTLPNPPVNPVALAIPKATIDGLEDGLYFLQFKIFAFPGGDEYSSEISTFVLDTLPPGGSVLPLIDFPEEIDRGGLTLKQLLDMPGQELQGVIPNYEFQDIGDVISLKMKLRDGGEEIDAGTVTVTSKGAQIDVAFDRATLEQVDGAGLVDFYYYVTDDAGNDRPDPSRPTPVNMMILGAPEVIPAPVVPGFEDDGLVTDPDARSFMLVEIPAYDPPALVGDIIGIHIGNRIHITPPLIADDIGNDPLLIVEVPYLTLFQGLDGASPDPVFDVDVWYDVSRVGLISPSDRVHVFFDLRIPGGPDPDPDPDDPTNENLRRAILRGATGDTDNLISPADALVDATAVIPWLNMDPEPVRSFEEGDVIQLYLDNDAAGAPYTVTAADIIADGDLELVMPTADMRSHIGAPDFWYKVTRTLDSEPPQEVVVDSPTQLVTIQSLNEIPGGGDPLPKVRFTRAAYREIDGNPYAQNTDATRADGGALIRFPEYLNMAVGDVIAYTFQGYDGFNPGDGDGDPVDGTLYENTHTVTAADLVPRQDDTVDPPERHAYVELLVPEAFVWPIFYGSATLNYTATSALGEGTGEEDLVFMDVRGGPAATTASKASATVARARVPATPRRKVAKTRS